MELKANADGSLLLTKEALDALNISLTPDSSVLIGGYPDSPTRAHSPLGLEIRATSPQLRRVYIEPTTKCNLRCTTCIRNTWNEEFTNLDWDVFESLIDELKGAPQLEKISFWGYGEPLLHPRIASMVAAAHGLGVKTQIISNGTLLSEAMASDLLDAGLSSIIVSLDGAGSQSYEGVRRGADYDVVVRNLRQLVRLRRRRAVNRTGSTSVEVGIEYVAQASTIDQIADIHALAADIGVDFVFVSNVLPFRANDQDELLYAASVYGQRKTPRIYLPPMDNKGGAAEAIARMMAPDEPIHYLQQAPSACGGYCPFVGEGSVVIGASGQVAPCMALLHSAPCFVMGRKKAMNACEFGNLSESSLGAIWDDGCYRAFRERVQRFDFAPCVQCTGCKKAKDNGRDCHGSPFPSCGDCLWAQGVIQCP